MVETTARNEQTKETTRKTNKKQHIYNTNEEEYIILYYYLQKQLKVASLTEILYMRHIRENCIAHISALYIFLICHVYGF